jgi:hypothetical protein
MPVSQAAHALGLTTDDRAWLLVHGVSLTAALRRDTAPQASLASPRCAPCQDALAVHRQPAPWGGEMGVWTACSERAVGTDAQRCPPLPHEYGTRRIRGPTR